ncbi:MAG: EscU/YscU/HrcU family type III secretion system export apparatus switch protein [Selenomonadaceae bacterium]|nr:EscU/YscU/HrcU family type III secretion system export apparatus switch protein [Selenomonadaceae bacterium]MDY2684657.1 EscU/YscU/HrcU family type III secretion system export apparatus switch protein [Selenomonadaceae bacterium]
MLKDRQKLQEEPETDPNAEKKAVAMRYDAEKDHAPRVVAKGRGHVAENILMTAQKHTVPVYQNKTLVNMLMALDIDREIPPELYRTVAEVMAYVYRMDAKKGAERQKLPFG